MGKIIKILKKDKILRTFKYINYKIICNLILKFIKILSLKHIIQLLFIFYFYYNG